MRARGEQKIRAGKGGDAQGGRQCEALAGRPERRDHDDDIEEGNADPLGQEEIEHEDGQREDDREQA